MPLALCALIFGTAVTHAIVSGDDREEDTRGPRSVVAHAKELVKEGRQIFRFDTFGDEVFWGGTLKLHQAIAGAALGGVGRGVSPATALAVGLKVCEQAIQLVAGL